MKLLLARTVSLDNQEVLINPAHIVIAQPTVDQKHTALKLVDRGTLEITMHWTDFCNWLRSN